MAQPTNDPEIASAQPVCGGGQGTPHQQGISKSQVPMGRSARPAAGRAGRRRERVDPVAAVASATCRGRWRLRSRVAHTLIASCRAQDPALCRPSPSEGQTVDLSREQAHYLFAVMRLRPGRCGGAVQRARRGVAGDRWPRRESAAAPCAVEAQTAPQQDPPDLWLLFAPIKKARTDFIVEKAAEMGAARIMPVQTDFTNAERIRQDRLQAHAVEAAEQCGGTYVPPVEELQASDRGAGRLADGPAAGLRRRGAGRREAGPCRTPDAAENGRS
jgi:hypothetical protein